MIIQLIKRQIHDMDGSSQSALLPERREDRTDHLLDARECIFEDHTGRRVGGLSVESSQQQLLQSIATQQLGELTLLKVSLPTESPQRHQVSGQSRKYCSD